jgi:shikimate dehydrogenase
MSVVYAEVIGDPIAQSKSPAIHGFWLAELGIDADYRACHVIASGLADYLASDESSYTTGQIHLADGGFAL